MRTNLLKETIRALKACEKELTDVVWVGSREITISIDNFVELANKTNYDNGYGGNEIVGDLVIVGKDWWLERWEYDGSEGWTFKQIPKMQSVMTVVKTFKVDENYNDSLSLVNTVKENT